MSEQRQAETSEVNASEAFSFGSFPFSQLLAISWISSAVLAFFAKKCSSKFQLCAQTIEESCSNRSQLLPQRVPKPFDFIDRYQAREVRVRNDTSLSMPD